jgi:hypothetical protein
MASKETLRIRRRVLSRIEHILKNRINRNLKRDKNAKWKINQRQVALKLETALWEEGKNSLDEYSNLGTVVTRLKMLSDKYRVTKLSAAMSLTKIA